MFLYETFSEPEMLFTDFKGQGWYSLFRDLILEGGGPKAKGGNIFRETTGVVSLVLLFFKVAPFGETCFAKQQKTASSREMVRNNMFQRGYSGP
jgi:hypothetical protein